MSARGLTLLRKVLTILPVIRANQGIRVSELGRLSGVSEEEIVTDLPKLVNLCGVPPYSPADLVDLSIEGDRVSVRFAEQFRRPVRLTLREALALDMALAGWEEEEEGPFARAVVGIRDKVRSVLAPEVAEGLTGAADRISSVPGPGRAARMVSTVKSALALQVALEIEYFSARSGELGERTIHPYGIYEQGGHWYVVARDAGLQETRTFRADRVRTAELTDEEYEIPEEFEVARFRREGPPEPAEPEFTARIRFSPDAVRYAREWFPAREYEEAEDGSAVATVPSSGVVWLASELMGWGGRAEVLEPSALRAALIERARRTLDLYRR